MVRRQFPAARLNFLDSNEWACVGPDGSRVKRKGTDLGVFPRLSAYTHISEVANHATQNIAVRHKRNFLLRALAQVLANPLSASFETRVVIGCKHRHTIISSLARPVRCEVTQVVDGKLGVALKDCTR